jgi:glycosyltransferase involved in cell wall biosynthesis
LRIFAGNRTAIKVTYIISDVDKALAFEWLAKYLSPIYSLSFILIGKENTALAAFLKLNAITFYEVSYAYFPSRFSQWLRILNILRKENPDCVHTHLWRANQLGLSAAWLLRIKKRIFTRHHATIHYDEIPAGRKWDRLCNFLATDIIAISKNIESILVEKDKANPQKIKLIHHGFDFDYFQSTTESRVALLRNKYKLSETDGPIIGVIARYMRWKGVEYVIQAFQDVLLKHPRAKLVLANAKGDYKNQIQHALKALASQSFVEIPFEEDLAALYRLFDIYVHVPYDAQSEAFGQTYVEALIMGVPSIFTLSGVAREFIEHQVNAWVVDFKNSKQIAAAINEMSSNTDLCQRLIRQGKVSVEPFSLKRHLASLEKLYTS